MTVSRSLQVTVALPFAVVTLLASGRRCLGLVQVTAVQIAATAAEAAAASATAQWAVSLDCHGVAVGLPQPRLAELQLVVKASADASFAARPTHTTRTTIASNALTFADTACCCCSLASSLLSVFVATAVANAVRAAG